MSIQTCFSPTVSQIFKVKPSWFIEINGFEKYDSEGYSAQGYHKKTNKDRAGYTKQDYDNSLEFFENFGYDSVLYRKIEKDWNISLIQKEEEIA